MWKRTTAALCLIVLVYSGVLLSFVRAQEREGHSADGKGQPEVITIWYWDDSMVEIFDRYVADTGKNVRLNYINVSISDYARQLKSAIDISNELPDVCLLQDYYAGNFLDIPVWEDLSREPYGLDLSLFPESCAPYVRSESGRLGAVPYNLDAAGLAYRAGGMKEVFGVDTPGEAMALFPTWDAVIERGLEQKAAGKEFMLFNCLGDVGSMMFNQTDQPYVRNRRMVRPERFLQYFRDLSRLYRTGLVGSTSQVSMEWSEDYRDESYIMAPWSLWISQYEAFSVNPKEDWVLIGPPGGSFKWGGLVCCIPSSSTHKEAAWEFVHYLTQTEEGAEANREAKCRQLIYYQYQNGDPSYKHLNIQGFGSQDVGGYFTDCLMPGRYERPLSPYDLELDEIYHLAVDAIIHQPDLTPEEIYGHFLEMLETAAPGLVIPQTP